MPAPAPANDMPVSSPIMPERTAVPASQVAALFPPQSRTPLDEQASIHHFLQVPKQKPCTSFKCSIIQDSFGQCHAAHTSQSSAACKSTVSSCLQAADQQPAISLASRLQQSNLQAQPNSDVSAGPPLPTPSLTDAAQGSDTAAVKSHHRPTRSAAQNADPNGT